MQRAETPVAAASRDLSRDRKTHKRVASYQKVLDARKRPVRGLWVRNGRYYARLSIPDTATGVLNVRRVPLEVANSAAEAQAALRRLLTERLDETLPALRMAPKLKDYVAEYFACYAQATGAKRPKTLQTERSHLNAWVKHFGGVRLHHLNRAMVNKFIALRQAEGANPRTVNLAVTCLRNVLRRAMEDKWIKTLPTENLRPLKWTPKKRELFSDAQVRSVCEAAFRPVFDEGRVVPAGAPGVPLKNARQFADFVELLVGCGSRMSETLRLKWSDVNWQLGQLTIGSDGLSKNHRSRVVDFNPRLKTHLEAMLERRVPDSEWLFPSPQRGERDEHAKSFRESLKLARAAAGLPKFGFHDCRHFFISMCVMSGIDYRELPKTSVLQRGV